MGLVKHTSGWAVVSRSFAFDDAPRSWNETDWPRGLRERIEPSTEYLSELLAWFDRASSGWLDAIRDDVNLDELRPVHWGETWPLRDIVAYVAAHWAYPCPLPPDVPLVERRCEPAYSIRMGGEVLSVTQAIKTCFQKDAEFRGRASRPEFWWFVLLYYMVILAPALPLIALASKSSRDQLGFDESVSGVALFFVFLTGVAVLAFIIPYLAAGVRRLHDTGKSGWWWLLALVPFGWIVLLVFLVVEGDKGLNQYGSPPGVQPVQPAPPGSLPPPPPPPVIRQPVTIR